MNSAISGLQAQQTKLDSIGDNLANVNTIAFKQTRVQFETLLSQTLTRGQAPQGTLGAPKSLPETPPKHQEATPEASNVASERSRAPQGVPEVSSEDILSQF